MGSLVLNILFVSVGAVVGAIGGWFLRGGMDFPVVETPPEKAPEPPPADHHYDQLETLAARLHQLTASVAADVGEHNTRVQAMSDELNDGGDVVSIVERLVHANAEMQTQLKAAEKRLESQTSEIQDHIKEARTDALTKVANRRAFDDEIRRCVDDFQAKNRASCVMMIDVDHFKKFNDTYGHLAGDEVLKGVARVLRREFAGKEIVCRYGGEEFAVIFPGVDLNSVIPLAEQGRAALSHAVFEFQGKDLRVTASGGLAQLRVRDTAERLVKCADEALYACKEKGRNCGYYHDGQDVHPMKRVFAPATAPADVPSNLPVAIAGPAELLSNRTITPPNAPPEAPTGEPKLSVVENSDPPARNAVFKLGGEPVRPDRQDRIAGLSDKESFCRDLDRRLAEQQRTHIPNTVVIIEMDGFEKIAADAGAKAAELAFRATAQVVKVTMRDMDHAARFSKAGISLLLPGSQLADGRTVAERMRSAIENCRIPANGAELRFTVSLGVAETRDDDDHETLMDRAAFALGLAKEQGGNCSQMEIAPTEKEVATTTS